MDKMIVAVGIVVFFFHAEAQAKEAQENVSHGQAGQNAEAGHEGRRPGRRVVQAPGKEAQRQRPGSKGAAALPIGGRYHCVFTKGADLTWRGGRSSPSLTNDAAAFQIEIQKEALALTLDEQSEFKPEEQSLLLVRRLVTPSGTSIYSFLSTGTGMLILHQGNDGRIVTSQWNSYFMPLSDTIYQSAVTGTCTPLR
jgi:hypothetical protein